MGAISEFNWTYTRTMRGRPGLAWPGQAKPSQAKQTMPGPKVRRTFYTRKHLGPPITSKGVRPGQGEARKQKTTTRQQCTPARTAWLPGREGSFEYSYSSTVYSGAQVGSHLEITSGVQPARRHGATRALEACYVCRVFTWSRGATRRKAPREEHRA